MGFGKITGEVQADANASSDSVVVDIHPLCFSLSPPTCVVYCRQCANGDFHIAILNRLLFVFNISVRVTVSLRHTQVTLICLWVEYRNTCLNT